MMDEVKNVDSSNVVYLYTDGSCRGNPGDGAIAVVICSERDEVLHEYSEFIGSCTSNQAEYKALIKGLELCANYTTGFVLCTADSLLLIKQVTGDYRINNEALILLADEVKSAAWPFQKVKYRHVSRTHQRIRRADALANAAQDGRCVNNLIVEPAKFNGSLLESDDGD